MSQGREIIAFRDGCARRPAPAVRWLTLLGCLFLAILVARPLHAQDEDETEKPTRDKRKRNAAEKREEMLGKLPRGQRRPPSLEDLSFSSRYEEFRPGETENILVLTGAVRVDGKSFRLRAESVVLWIDSEKFADAKAGRLETSPDESDTPDEGEGEEETEEAFSQLVRRLYAEGNVEYRSGSEIVRVDQILLDLATDQGVLIEGYLHTYVEARGQKLPAIVRAEEILQLAEGRFLARNAQLTNCSFGKPHWHISAKEVEVNADRENSTTSFFGSQATASFGKIPFFYLPYFAGSAGSGSNFYFRSLRGGRTSRFGFFGLSEWGDDIRLSDGTRWGKWTVRADLFEDRGFGSGLDIEYRQPSYFGELISYRIHDEGDEDKRDQPIEREERSRVLYRHRHFLPGGFMLDGEINWLSDRNFLEEFFEDEFKERKEPETVAYAKQVGDQHMFTLTGRFQLNDFQTQVEYLPRATYDLIFEPLLPEPIYGTNVYYSQRTEAANVRIRFDEDLDPATLPVVPGTNPPVPQEDRIHRADTIHRIDAPIPLGPFKLSPFQQLRYSSFSETVSDEDTEGRYSATGGVSLTTKLSRVFDVQSRMFKIRGLRHVATPRITYTNTWGVTDDPNEFIQFDNVDRVRERETIRFELRNRIQTRRGDKTTDLVNFDVKVDFFPDQDRDNSFTVVENGIPREVTRAWGNLDMDLITRLTNRFSMIADAEYDFRDDDFPVANVRLVGRVSPKVRTALGYRGFKGRKTLATAVVEAQVTDRWTALLRERYDFREDQSEEFALLVRRDAHEWIIELGFEVDDGDDDTRFMITVQPKALFRSRFGRDSRIGRQPGGDLFQIN